MKSIKNIIVVLVALIATSVSAQEYNDLDDSVNEQISIRVRQDVNLFTDFLSLMVDKTQSAANRNSVKEDALKLFIGGGKEYYDDVLDVSGEHVIDRVRHDAVRMEVTSLKSTAPKKYPMATYLSNLVNLANRQIYRSVSIESTNWHEMKVSRIRKISENHYVCDVYFEQVFISRGRENKVIYTDTTRKRVACYIEIAHRDTGDEFIILLGDISAMETHPNTNY